MFEAGERITPNPNRLIPSASLKVGEIYTVVHVEVHPTRISHERALAYVGEMAVELNPKPDQGHQLVHLVEFPGRQFWAGYFIKSE